jgi:CRISPR-associated protein Csx14
METPKANIRIPVDLTNPGQFFACCGLLELADRLWPGAEASAGVVGWFEKQHFCMLAEHRFMTLQELLAETQSLSFDVGDDTEGEDDDDKDDGRPVGPIQLHWKNGKPAIYLDWWSEKAIKPWAGSMKERVILRAMLSAIDTARGDPFNDLKRVLYRPPKLTKAGKPSKPKKKEPFYFDPRRGNKSHPLDCGFSPDTHHMEAECCPALEALCFIGLQRARPAPTGVANQSRYTVWHRLSLEQPGIPASLVGAIACAAIRLPRSNDYVFDNYFRTDQRKHKAFSPSTPEGSTNGSDRRTAL